ncbi:MAG TPA: hypothetical protein VK171_07540 [Fimbriimonas sp.]|nr:hypothetical protein [Fimbriimonas sp.]
MVQRAIFDALKLEGFEPYKTSRDGNASSVSEGIPDLLVVHGDSKHFAGLEVKAKDAKGEWHYSCTAQWDLHRRGKTAIVTSPEQAVSYCCQVFGVKPRVFKHEEPEPVGPPPKGKDRERYKNERVR